MSGGRRPDGATLIPWANHWLGTLWCLAASYINDTVQKSGAAANEAVTYT